MKIFSVFKKTKIIHVVDSKFNYIKENIKIKKIPVIGEKIYFNENVIYVVTDIIHYIGNHQTIWLIVEEQPTEK